MQLKNAYVDRMKYMILMEQINYLRSSSSFLGFFSCVTRYIWVQMVIVRILEMEFITNIDLV